MRVINNTDYPTKELKKLFMECAKINIDNRNKLKVKVRYTKSRFILGWAWTDIEIALPKKYVDLELMKRRWPDTYEKKLAYLNFNRTLAFVFIHETFHILHKQHKDMRGSYYTGWKYFFTNSSRLSFADKYILERR